MSMATEVLVGNKLRVHFYSYNLSGVLTDPSTVVLKVRHDQTVTEYNYADGSLTKAAVGHYYKDYTPSLDGSYHFRWETTGDPTIAEETTIIVKASKVL